MCDRATFVFDSRVDIPKGVFQSVPLELVDTRGWDEAVLTVVKHAGSSFTTGNLLVAAFQAAHKAEDPSVDFTGTDIAQLWMEYGTLAPLQTARLSPVGAALRLLVQQANDGSAGATSVILSVWVTLRRPNYGRRG